MTLDVLFDRQRRKELQDDIGSGRKVKFRTRILDSGGMHEGAKAGDMNPGESFFDYRPTFAATIARRMSDEDKEEFRNATGKDIGASSPDEIIDFMESEGVSGKKPEGQ
jgi:hypothetical protein